MSSARPDEDAQDFADHVECALNPVGAAAEVDRLRAALAAAEQERDEVAAERDHLRQLSDRERSYAVYRGNQLRDEMARERAAAEVLRDHLDEIDDLAENAQDNDTWLDDEGAAITPSMIRELVREARSGASTGAMALLGEGCAICGDPTHSTARHEATIDDDFCRPASTDETPHCPSCHRPLPHNPVEQRACPATTEDRDRS